MNKILLFILLSLLLVVFVKPAQKVGATSSPPLTINADGSITPSTTLITSIDNITYTLTDNITTNSGYQVINILRDNIILDGAGYTIQHVNRYSGIYIGYRNNVTVRNLRIVDSGDAIHIDADTWLTIDNCTFIGNYRGVYNGYTAGPTNFTFTNNEVKGRDCALNLATADSIISGNIIQAEYGFYIWTDNVTIKDNLITGCSWTGIAVISASNTSIFDNTFSNNGIGITVPAGALRIYHNYFINNNEHARGADPALYWDDGYPSGGNYWSGFVSPDLYSGEYQNITGGDGIGDNPYISTYYGYVHDRYPLMLLGISNVSQTPPKSNVMPDDAVEVNATVRHVYPLAQVILNCTYTNSSATWTSIINMTNLEDDIWHGIIPPFPAGTNVTYAIIAHDDIGNSVSSEDQGYIFEYPVVPEFPSFLIPSLFMMATLLAVTLYKKKHASPKK